MNTTKLLVKKILEKPLGHDWSIQGFGMLRLYLADELRMHIWNSKKMVEDVSLIHTHPWDFVSEVVVGQITNVRYTESTPGTPFSLKHQYAKIRCGVGGGIAKGELQAERGEKWLVAQDREIYSIGETYTQSANEIHRSEPKDGTVTIVRRYFKSDPDHAYVFWDHGDWVSAEPRKATDEEVLFFCNEALKWF